MDSEGPQFERCKFSILGIEANFDCDFRKWLCKCWIIYFLGGLPTKLVRTVLLWQVFFYFEVSMEMFSVSLKLFTQYLCRKIFQATPFTSHTLQLENSRVHIFRLYHVFFFACVCNMQWLVCSRKLAQAQHLFYREIPERTQLFPASHDLNLWFVCTNWVLGESIGHWIEKWNHSPLTILTQVKQTRNLKYRQIIPLHGRALGE